MQHEHSITHSFGPQAEAYLTSTVHAQGEDLMWLAESVVPEEGAVILDLGCGAGHASFAVAPLAKKVVAYDITQSMLDVVALTARTRSLDQIETRHGSVEKLPFEGASFDCVISRYSAHHWFDVRLALSEVKRMLKPSGKFCFIDVVGGPAAAGYASSSCGAVARSESCAQLHCARVAWTVRGRLPACARDASLELPIEFGSWISRIGTPEKRVNAITALWSGAPNEVRSYFNLQDNLSFELDVAMFDARI